MDAKRCFSATKLLIVELWKNRLVNIEIKIYEISSEKRRNFLLAFFEMKKINKKENPQTTIILLIMNLCTFYHPCLKSITNLYLFEVHKMYNILSSFFVIKNFFYKTRIASFEKKNTNY